MASILQAIDDKADWVEIDVQESQDGVVVVAHDSDLKKVAGVGVKIWEATAEELQAIDIGSYFGPEFKDQRVPTLADVLEACRGRVGVNIELKYYGHNQNLEQKVVDLVEQHQMAGQIVIMSLEAAGVQKVKQLRPQWTVGLLTAVVAGDLTRTDVDFLAVNTNLATASFVRSAHAKQKKVHVWTVNDVITMSMMISRGADNLITDHPGLARQVLRERAAMSPAERLLTELAFLFGVAPPAAPEQ
jgi:glycerophosphoryl diester phosphodiesterase